MEAHPRTPRQLFDGKEHYQIPAFQRPYVWSMNDQWAPLWSDIQRVAEAVVRSEVAEAEGRTPVPNHFLGAVVYEPQAPVAGDVVRHDVIDGQQRMTTLQLLLDAVEDVVKGRGHDLMAEELEGLIKNRGTAFRGKRERFKLWPSQADRRAFEHAMDPSEPWSGEPHRIIEAHDYFKQEALSWVRGDRDDAGQEPPGSEEARVSALVSTLEDKLVLIAIDLSGTDDAQLVFETLNDRGTPLLKADLIKNWLFRRGEQVGSDVQAWAERFWDDFDSQWWRDEVRQGRLQRSRVDVFLQYWLTMRLADDIRADQVFRSFTEYANPRMKSSADADALMRALRADADLYQSFAQLDAWSPEGRFHRRVIEGMELAVTTPLFLWLLSGSNAVPQDQRSIALEALESWAIRRSLLRLTTKNINLFVTSVLRDLSGGQRETAGADLRRILAEQTAESRYWPSDDELRDALVHARLYGNIRQSRLRLVLGAIERHQRAQSSMHEAVDLPSGLEVEHIMPRAWRAHWDTNPGLDPEAAARRDALLNTIGNLTLITKSLNASLSNRPWTSSAAAGLEEGGQAGLGKHALLDQFSLLIMNRTLLRDHPDAWTEEDIEARSRWIAEAIVAVWPGPDPRIQAEARAAATDPATGSKRDEVTLPWSESDITRLAEEVGPAVRIVLDTLADHPGEGWTNKQFVEAGLTDHAYAAVGALTMKARHSFGRANVPVAFTRNGSTWFWSVDEAFARTWKAARAAT